ncbi:hypothetical protein MNBD_GAMMA03-911 [hydrothermal vent metagenome]|uniref:dihydroneopterin aldolase n=1 Tax=hydrothermal vent metagenome TaxID=652676 RepID=A0A3B0VW60_9ZZZZ
MATIFIEELAVEAIIGVYQYERDAKQPVLINIEMQYDSSHAGASDNLNHALDYHKITKDIHSFVSESSFNLIETLAEAIAQRILTNQSVTKVRLSVAKPQALNNVKNVGIRITRSLANINAC